MSRYGVVTGVNGNIQFDTNRKNIGAWEYGNIPSSGWTAIPTSSLEPPTDRGYIRSFDYNCQMIGIAIRPNTSTFVGSRIGTMEYSYENSISGSAPPIFITLGNRGNIYASSPTTIEYAIYSLDAESRTIPPWGLITYDENGVIVFNSGLRHLKITEIIEVNRTPLVTIDNFYWPGPGTVTFSHNTSNPFYIIPNNYIEMNYTTWPGDGRMWLGRAFMTIGIQKISATSARLQRFILALSGPLFPVHLGFENKIDAFFEVPNPLRIAVCVL